MLWSAGTQQITTSSFSEDIKETTAVSKLQVFPFEDKNQHF